MSDADPYAELLALCAQGDQKAFARLYERTSPRLYAVCLRLLRTRSLAEEALQDGYLKIWRSAASFDPRRATAMTWMTTVMRNRCLDLLRQRRARPQEVDMEYEGMDFASDDLSPSDVAGLSLAARRVMDCLETLQDRQRQSILMAYYYGQTHEEIARKLGSPLGTVKAWVRRGIERLRKCLE